MFMGLSEGDFGKVFLTLAWPLGYEPARSGSLVFSVAHAVLS